LLVFACVEFHSGDGVARAGFGESGAERLQVGTASGVLGAWKMDWKHIFDGRARVSAGAKAAVSSEHEESAAAFDRILNVSEVLANAVGLKPKVLQHDEIEGTQLFFEELMCGEGNERHFVFWRPVYVVVVAEDKE